MPAEPEDRITEHLGQLRADVTRVDWAVGSTVRARGARRTRNHAVAGALTTLVVLGAAGFGFFGGPFRAGTDPADVAGVPVEAPAYSSAFSDSSPDGTSSAPSSPQGETSESESTDTGGESTEGETQTESEPSTPPSTSKSPETTGTEPDTTPSTTRPTTTPAEEPTTTTPSDDATTPSETPSTTTTSPPMSTNRSNELLLVPASMYVVGDGAWSTEATRTVESATIAQCQTSTLTDLGASDAAHRSYLHDTDSAVTGGHVVGIFDTEDDAIAAYDSLTGGAGQCTWGNTPDGPNEVTVDDGAAQWWFIGSEGDDGSGEFEVIGFVQRGATVAVVTMYQPGMDYSEDPTSTLRAAWDLLDPDS